MMDKRPRVCTKCHQEKEWFDFYDHKNGNANHSSWCIACELKFHNDYVIKKRAKRIKSLIRPKKWGSEESQQLWEIETSEGMATRKPYRLRSEEDR